MNFSDVTRAGLSDQVLRVATLGAVVDTFTTKYQEARKDAEKALRAGGIVKVAIRLPNGEAVGDVTVTQPSPHVAIDEDAFLAYVAEHQPDEIEEYLEASALLDQELIEYCRAKRDDLLKQRVRPVWRKELTKKIVENGGYVVTDEATGEAVKLATVTKVQPTGAFALSADAHGARSIRLMTALLAGELGDVVELPAVQPPALPAGGFYGASQ